MPMTNSQAKAEGLTEYHSARRCPQDGTTLRTVRGNRCVACKDREGALRDKIEAAVRAKVRAQVLREVAAEAKQAERQAAKEERAKERRRLKAAETRARNKAAREAAAQEAAAASASVEAKAVAVLGQEEADPWDDDSAPWD